MNDEIQALADDALAHMDIGRMDAAKEIYARIIKLDPANIDAWLMLAAINGEYGDLEEAIQCCQRAVELEPDNAEANVILGRLNIGKGDHEAAVKHFQLAVESDPDDGEVWALLAGLVGQLGRYPEAEKYCHEAMRLHHFTPEVSTNLVNALLMQQKAAEAEEVCNALLKQDPGRSDLRNGLALAYESMGEFVTAAQAYRSLLDDPQFSASARSGLARAAAASGDTATAEQELRKLLQFNPEDLSARYQLGRMYEDLQRYEEAQSCYSHILAENPSFAEAWIGIGNVQQNTGDLDSARQSYSRALPLAPENADIHYNTGVMENRLGNFTEAQACFDRAIELRPNYLEAHWDKAFVSLLLGDYEAGWREYEWRLRRNAYSGRSYPCVEWDGASLIGQTILVHDEQGYGDTFQFIRYLSLLKELGAEVVLECHRGLGEVLNSCSGCDRVIEREANGGLPSLAYDRHIHLMSLPYMFKTTRETVPRNSPYLWAREDLVEKWRERLAHDDAFKIGICWAGSPGHTNEANRSCPLAMFTALNKVPGISLYSLQKGDALGQVEDVAQRLRLKLFGNELDSEARFVDTAAIMCNLDLVISIDTSIVHLAGALGCQVWTLLSLSPDWRWGLEGIHTPWYPTMRLFRQRKIGDWEEVFNRVTSALPVTISKTIR